MSEIEVISTTLQQQEGDLADSVLDNIALTSLMKAKGNIVPFTGGYEIRKAVLHNDTPTGGFYSQNERFNMNSVDDVDVYKYKIAQCYEPFVISGRDMRANKGTPRIIDLVDAKYKATKSRLKNVFETSLKGDGTSFGGKGFDGIQKHVAQANTSGSVGGISRANVYAQNQILNSTGLTALNVQEYCTEMILKLTRGSERPQVAFAGNQAYRHLHSSLTAIQRLTDGKTANGGFRSLVYDGVEFYFDGGIGGEVVGTNTIRFINLDYISFDVESQANFKMLESKAERAFDQDTYANVIIVEGNLCVSAHQFLGLVY